MSTGPMTNRDLFELETTITNGFAKFLEVGAALLEIQARKLYRDDGYATFEQYCAKRWSISRSQASRMIQAAEVVGHLSGDPDMPLPMHETQTRALARLREPEAIRTVWEEVVDEYGESVSAPKVREAVDYHAAIEEKPERAAWPREEVVARYREEQKRGGAPLPPAAPSDEPPPLTHPEAAAQGNGEVIESSARERAPDHDLHARLAAGHHLLTLDPAAWAPHLDGEAVTEVRVLVAALRAWCDMMEAELRRTPPAAR